MLNKGRYVIKYKTICQVFYNCIACRRSHKQVGEVGKDGNTNRVASMDPTGEIAIEKSGCTSYCRSQEVAFTS